MSLSWDARAKELIDTSAIKSRRPIFRRRTTPRRGLDETQAACHPCCAGPSGVVMKAID
jgi:hypothetical protein